MKKSLLLFAIANMINFISCIPDAEYRNLETPSTFKGDWVGNYTGDENGTLVFNVSNSGGFFGEKISKIGIREGFNGYVKIGNFSGTTASNYIFISKTTPNNFEISGEWSKNSLKGTFIVKKK